MCMLMQCMRWKLYRPGLKKLIIIILLPIVMRRVSTVCLALILIMQFNVSKSMSA